MQKFCPVAVKVWLFHTTKGVDKGLEIAGKGE